MLELRGITFPPPFRTRMYLHPGLLPTPPDLHPDAMTEKEAQKQVKKEKEFYGHLAAYLVCNAAFVAMGLATGAYWFIFPLFFWGIGLGNHATQVFGLPGKGADWEERRMRELLGQEQTQAGLDALRDQLRRLERGERTTARTEESETAMLRRRIENLEAIVTSRDWDLLDDGYRPAEPALDLDAPSEPEGPAGRAERLARRVR